MAPARLVRRAQIKERAELYQTDDKWDSLRFRIIARTPTVLLEYYFEILLGALAIVGGLGAVLGLSTSTITSFLPFPIFLVYGSLLLLGGLTVLGGLKSGRYGTILPMGLRLLAASCAAYAFAVLFAVGLQGGATAIGNALILSILAGWRAFLLRSTFILAASHLAATVEGVDTTGSHK